MEQANITFTEDAEGALIFQYAGRKYLYAGRKDGIMYGISTARKEWKELLEDAGNREYEKVGSRAVAMGLDFVHFDLGILKIDVVAKLTDLMETYDDFEGLGIMTISKTDCRSPDGITIGLIDGMIAMARVLRKANLGSAEVQEALKDFTTDEDVKWLMEHSVQNWEFGADADKDWELGDPLQVVIPESALQSAVEPSKDGKYKVEYCQKTWPAGWDHEDSTIEFDSRDEMNTWLLGKIEWCKYEDNGFRCRVYLYKDNFPHSIGKGEWLSDQFVSVGLSWVPTLDILSDMEWMK
jgi:hypothetical protein